MIKKTNLLEIISVFCNAIDTINPILKKHHRRVTIIAYNIGKELGLRPNQMANLVLAASLHDIGALTVSDADMLAELDVFNPEPHALLGSKMLSHYAPFTEVSRIIRYHHMRYDVYKKDSLEELVPIEALIIHLADRIEILSDSNILVINQVKEITSIIDELSGTMFSPTIIDAFLRCRDREYFWYEIDDLSIDVVLNRIKPDFISIDSSVEDLEDLVYTLSRVIDYKSEFTATHSKRVAHLAYRLAISCGMSEEAAWEVKIAGYMHDIGKIAVPSEIINKPGALTANEYNIMKSHPYYTYQILKHIRGFEQIAEWAGAHHEKRDASGYPRKPNVSKMGIEIEIITYADLFAALSENRPYRNSLPVEEVLGIIEFEYKAIVGETIYPILVENSTDLYREIFEL